MNLTPKDLRTEQRLGEMIEGEEDESWASPVCFNRSLSEDLLRARPWAGAEKETEKDRHSLVERQP